VSEEIQQLKSNFSAKLGKTGEMPNSECRNTGVQNAVKMVNRKNSQRAQNTFTNYNFAFLCGLASLPTGRQVCG